MGRRIWDAQRNRYVRKYSFYMEKKPNILKPAGSLEEKMKVLSSVLPNTKDRVRFKESKSTWLLDVSIPKSQSQSGEDSVVVLDDKTFDEEVENLKSGISIAEEPTTGRSLVKYIPKMENYFEQISADTEVMRIAREYLRSFDFFLSHMILFPLRLPYQAGDSIFQLMSWQRKVMIPYDCDPKTKHESIFLPESKKSTLALIAQNDEAAADLSEARKAQEVTAQHNGEALIIDTPNLKAGKHRPLCDSPSTRKKSRRRGIKDWFIQAGRMVFACICYDPAE